MQNNIMVGSSTFWKRNYVCVCTYVWTFLYVHVPLCVHRKRTRRKWQQLTEAVSRYGDPRGLVGQNHYFFLSTFIHSVLSRLL